MSRKWGRAIVKQVLDGGPSNVVVDGRSSVTPCRKAGCLPLRPMRPHSQASVARRRDPPQPMPSIPPCKGRTFLNPCLIRCRATSAAEASLGHAQYNTTSESRSSAAILIDFWIVDVDRHRARDRAAFVAMRGRSPIEDDRSPPGSDQPGRLIDADAVHAQLLHEAPALPPFRKNVSGERHDDQQQARLAQIRQHHKHIVDCGPEGDAEDHGDARPQGGHRPDPARRTFAAACATRQPSWSTAGQIPERTWQTSTTLDRSA